MHVSAAHSPITCPLNEYLILKASRLRHRARFQKSFAHGRVETAGPNRPAKYQVLVCSRCRLLVPHRNGNSGYTHFDLASIPAPDERPFMTKLSQIALLIVALAGIATAEDVAIPTPEIDARTAVSAVALIAGGLLVMRARRK